MAVAALVKVRANLLRKEFHFDRPALWQARSHPGHRSADRDGILHAAFAKPRRAIYEVPMPDEPKPQQVRLQVKYEDMTARYANQIVLTAGQEEVFLDFSSGVIPDQGGGVSVLPIHTRIAMPHGALQRFHQMLTKLVNKSQETGPAGASSGRK